MGDDVETVWLEEREGGARREERREEEEEERECDEETEETPTRSRGDSLERSVANDVPPRATDERLYVLALAEAPFGFFFDVSSVWRIVTRALGGGSYSGGGVSPFRARLTRFPVYVHR